MKKWTLGITAITIALVLILSGCMGQTTTQTTSPGTTATPTATQSATPTQVINLKFNSSFPPSHLFYKMDQYFIEQISKRTNDRVKVTMFPVGTLTDGPKVYSGVIEGVSDMGEVIPVYSPGRFPATDSLAIPLPAKNGWVYTHTANDFYQQFQPKEYKDVHVLFMDCGSGYVFQTRDKAIRKPDDLKGLKIRASGAVASSYVTLFGGAPVAMPMTDAYDAAGKGVIDAVLGAMDTLKSAKLAEVFNYVTVPPVQVTSAMVYVMNLEKWNSLPKDIQEIITQVSGEMVEAYASAWYFGEIDGQEYFLGKGGTKQIIEIPAAEAAAWNSLLAPIINKYIADQSAAGLTAAADYVKFNQGRAEYWNSKIPDKEICKKLIAPIAK